MTLNPSLFLGNTPLGPCTRSAQQCLVCATSLGLTKSLLSHKMWNTAQLSVKFVSAVSVSSAVPRRQSSKTDVENSIQQFTRK